MTLFTRYFQSVGVASGGGVTPGTDYVGSVLSLSPEAFWLCDEASGDLADSTGNGWTSSTYGAITGANYGISGPTINSEGPFDAILFNANTYPSSSITKPASTGFTLSAWVYGPTNSQNDSIFTIYPCLLLRKTTGNGLQIITYQADENTHGNAEQASFPNNTWTWVGARYDSGAGVLRAWIGSSSTDDTSFVGTWNRTGDPVVGGDDITACLIAYWTSPLSDADMTSLRTGVF